MSEAFQYIDILILAIIAGIVLLRLRSVLGRRTGHEKTDKTSYNYETCLLYTSPSPRDRTRARMPSSA